LNLNQVSRADLVGELLATPGRVSEVPIAGADAPTYGSDASVRLLERRLAVARELLLRNLSEAAKTGPMMSSPETVRDYLRLSFAGLGHEVFMVLFTDAQHRLIEAVPMFRGTLTQTSVYPREVVKTALLLNAAAAIFAHNHPSGHAEPSRADEHLTQTLKTALHLVDVHLLDHFVVANDQVVSFAERGLL
jgi:DNA repair protein RadC